MAGIAANQNVVCKLSDEQTLDCLFRELGVEIGVEKAKAEWAGPATITGRFQDGWRIFAVHTSSFVTRTCKRNRTQQDLLRKKAEQMLLCVST